MSRRSTFSVWPPGATGTWQSSPIRIVNNRSKLSKSRRAHSVLVKESDLPDEWSLVVVRPCFDWQYFEILKASSHWARALARLGNWIWPSGFSPPVSRSGRGLSRDDGRFTSVLLWLEVLGDDCCCVGG